MAVATWWYGDEREEFPELPGFVVQRAIDVGLIAGLNGLSRDEVLRRFKGGHRVFVASLDREPAAYGWLATRRAQIGEVNLRLTMPPENAYLWDFGTVESMRGLGLYPRLLDAIRERVTPRFTRLWIVHSPENGPSAAGIERAGFKTVGELSFDRGSKVRLRPAGRPERSIAAARFLGVHMTEEVLSACWTCETATACGCRDADHARCACHVAPRRGAVRGTPRQRPMSSTGGFSHPTSPAVEAGRA